MKLVRVGNKIFAPDQVIAASYIPAEPGIDTAMPQARCLLCLGKQDLEAFYGGDAMLVWSYLCNLEHCQNLAESEAEGEL